MQTQKVQGCRDLSSKTMTYHDNHVAGIARRTHTFQKIPVVDLWASWISAEFSLEILDILKTLPQPIQRLYMFFALCRI